MKKHRNFGPRMHHAEMMAKQEPERADYWFGYMLGMRRSQKGVKDVPDVLHNTLLTAASDQTNRQFQKAAGYMEGLHAFDNDDQEQDDGLEIGNEATTKVSLVIRVPDRFLAKIKGDPVEYFATVLQKHIETHY